SPDGRWLAYPSEDCLGLRLIDLTNPRPGTGTATSAGHLARITDMAFTPDGTRLVSICADGTGLVWDVAALTSKLRPKAPDSWKVEPLWEALADTDAEKAGQAIESMVRAPASSVGAIAGRLSPVQGVDPDPVRKLVAELDSSTYVERDRAER